jgi:DNA replication and repair protein RecF
MSAARIRRLTLTNFRSYRTAQLAIDDRAVVLIGPNGAGKTNLIEAISFLAPGRGLRRATLDEAAFSEGDGAWAVAAQVEGALGLATLGTGIAAPAADDATLARACRIDGESVASATAFCDHLSVVWMTPAMDSLFRGPPSERRRFLDRLVLAVDGEHGSRVNALERSLRSRNRLLEESSPDAHWLDAVEHETAEVAIAVAAARAETVRRLGSALAREKAEEPFPQPFIRSFPWAGVALDGWVENALGAQPASEVEDRYRAVLRANRARDKAAGRTTDGPHLTDLAVLYGPKGIAAADASTGEQKALLIGLVLAHAGLVAEMTGLAPVLLLDEVVAHLDPARRSALYAALGSLGAQVWMTGADPAAFAEITRRAQVLEVSPGRVS